MKPASVRQALNAQGNVAGRSKQWLHRSHALSNQLLLQVLYLSLRLGGSPSEFNQETSCNCIYLPNGETKQLPIWQGSDQCALKWHQYQLELVWKPGLEKRRWAQDCDDNIFAALSSASHMPSPVLRKTDLQQSKPDTETFTHKPPTHESFLPITPKFLICIWSANMFMEGVVKKKRRWYIIFVQLLRNHTKIVFVARMHDSSVTNNLSCDVRQLYGLWSINQFLLYNGTGHNTSQQWQWWPVVPVAVDGAGSWELRQPVAPRLAHSMLLKILPSVRSTHHVSAILTLGVLAVVISGQQQRRVIGFDAEGRITIQVQLQL